MARKSNDEEGMIPLNTEFPSDRIMPTPREQAKPKPPAKGKSKPRRGKAKGKK